MQALSVTVRLIVDHPDDPHVRGRVELADEEWEFAGWLALLSQLERLARVAPVADHPDE